MPWMRRSDRNVEKAFQLCQKAVDRPVVLDRPGKYYESNFSRIPERLRVSFSDGTTAVYQLAVELPAPNFQRKDWQNEVIGYRWKEEET